jgi:serine/threonine protein kinase
MLYEMLSGINPFKIRNKTNQQRLQMITDEEIPMMPMFEPEAKSLIQGLLQKDVSDLFYVAGTTSGCERDRRD